MLALAGLAWLFTRQVEPGAPGWGAPPPGWSGGPTTPRQPKPAEQSPAAIGVAEALRNRALNDPAALRELTARADAGDANMQFMLATIYDGDMKLGKPQDWDASKAARYYRLSGEQGMVYGQANYGLYLVYGKFGLARDLQAGFAWLSKAADAGLAFAQRHVGIAYRNGVGVGVDGVKALEYFRKAADQGDLYSKVELADAYWHGRPPYAQNRAEAVKIYREAANDPSYASAARMVGWAYMNGDGVSQDKTVALKWFRDAADRGDANAKSMIGDAYWNGWPPYPRDHAEAAKWYRGAAADPDQAGAARMLGMALRDGDGVLADPAEAAIWMRRAAEKNDAHAQAELGIGHFFGKGAYRQDYREAFKWLQKAAAANNESVAQRLLGVCYMQGYGTPPDPRQGVFWLQRASANGDREAAKLLRQFR
ncbi:TPR repeat protein [Rhodoblastus acidophilus]|uniref:tetratricopeptide repeat protein n=1 Tax=Rhodoblastus acidophilus TaxID=1074 RepID=UPI002224CEC6|nr:tetratricopeptide repeat protein [Rhodoblastus acidophilus]MCW2286330.1 TPR repeat protein [Rhodoblastus acidophilus]MCW2335225.1 TPR repeat protein [Rhodoblastus acidophilus]